MKRLIKAAVLGIAFSLIMLCIAGAASPREMYENGAVSDGSVSFGDMRDGVVSDVSEGGEIITGEGTGMMEGIMGGSDANGESSITAMPDRTSTPETTDRTPEATTSDTNGSTTADGDDGGRAIGVIVAVAVAIAVVVIIFLLMPKRRG